MQELPSYPVPDMFQGPGEPMGNDGPFTTMEVRLLRQVSGFGFRIIGGEEEGSQVYMFMSIYENVHDAHACTCTPCDS